MQISKPKMVADFIKTFDTPIYEANIDLNDLDIKAFIVEEEREDVKVIFEGYEDLVSNIHFDIIDGVLHIKVESKEQTGMSVAQKIHSVFTTENKLNIFLPIHFKKYLITGAQSRLRLNNIIASDVDVNITNGSIKVKYCELENGLNIVSENAHISLKSIKVNSINLTNKNGISKLRNIIIKNDMTIKSDNGIINAKDIDSTGVINAITKNGNIDFDDVYAKVVNVNVDAGVVNYFNGNFNKKFDVNINVGTGLVRTNVNREVPH